MSTFTAPDGTRLACHESGDGPPLVCLPGGPLQSAGYLGDLGGLTSHHRLIGLDPRGTGESATPRDTASYRCDRLVDDVEALRGHLGLDRMDLLAHSAGANLAVLYAARHPDRVARLLLITPSVYAVGLQITAEDRLATARLRRDEPWFAAAYAALEAVTAGRATADSWAAVAPFWHARWDEAARAFDEAGDRAKNHEAAPAHMAQGAFSPAATREALTAFSSPVLLLAGETDPAAPPPVMREFAQLFPNAELIVQPGASHFPWRDDAVRFVANVKAFTGGAAVPV
ncbi:alpha/beta fold hydrolase [Streptomyces rishiriensis]|uniref:Proline iminopeptidase n=1 Tax=Streptomyces rishiriensis TaxID=68264 RepID=A0ABU0NZC5_STRRH|nr:alpha/beta hydrolase [Streptomyces rishiriensis]MDQ0584496.1 proline iminopeptidase [Streptomyces rishiriensis]